MLGGEDIPVPACPTDGHPGLEGREDRGERELASPLLSPTTALSLRSDARPSSAPGLSPGRLRPGTPYRRDADGSSARPRNRLFFSTHPPHPGLSHEGIAAS